MPVECAYSTESAEDEPLSADEEDRVEKGVVVDKGEYIVDGFVDAEYSFLE